MVIAVLFFVLVALVGALVIMLASYAVGAGWTAGVRAIG